MAKFIKLRDNIIVDVDEVVAIAFGHETIPTDISKPHWYNPDHTETIQQEMYFIVLCFKCGEVQKFTFNLYDEAEECLNNFYNAVKNS